MSKTAHDTLAKTVHDALNKYTYEEYPAFVKAYETNMITKNVEHEVSFRILRLDVFFTQWLHVIRTFFPIITETISDETRVAFLHATYYYIKHLTNA